MSTTQSTTAGVTSEAETGRFDADLVAIQHARDKVVAAHEAMRSFQFASQEEVDRVCEAMVAAAMREAGPLGRMAHEETGFGDPAHKRIKNEFAASSVWESIRDVRTCGVIGRDEARGIVEIGWPVGVVAALAPSTNPTSTAIFKALIAVKARNGVVVAPHPSARRSTAEAVRVVAEAGERAGMPPGLVSCLTEVTVEGTHALMSHRLTSLVLATGGPGMVRAAHSCGKPAIGVGPGNVPAYVDRSADVEQAARMIVESKAFDCSTICATEQVVVADAPIADRLREAMRANGAHWLTRDEANRLAAMMFRPGGLMVADYVGRTPQHLGERAGIAVPADARVLVADLDGVGAAHPLSREKLTTVLGFMVADGWRAGCERSIELLRFGGDGHSIVVHASDEEVILAFGVEKPAFRILVNTWGSLGGIGATTGLDPSLTLAPGGLGGATVSDNVSVRHLLNVKRIAYHRADPPPGARVAGGGAPRAVAPPEADADAAAIERMVRRVLEQLGGGVSRG
ncbi:aldehyde dehydrogenase family protein [Xylanimonas ulmi]|uniref:Acetaldehyde dehydrogenase n=1 Tax=Xylanimonas ulmi TaxID=228973 RepID=A0A4Q7LY33_9MICO|nr:aldehyde dehydrogenase family protein [Xylanibacterium ulmi]RZS60055.1 acetaldehyde dehydrogenase [Xylanibacterium ulmi]